MTRLCALSITLILLLFSCSEENTSISVSDTAGQPVENFTAVISQNDSVRELTCENGSGENNIAQCTDKGINLSEKDPSFIYVKSKGYQFSGQEFIQKGKIVLTKLADYEKNDDYATGFTLEDGLNPFLEFSYKTSGELGNTYALKFLIMNVDTEPEVYFMNTKKHPLHYDFARQVLKIDQTIAEFEDNTYHGTYRTAMAGTILYYPDIENAGENGMASLFAVTFFPSDDLTPEQALFCHRLIEERMNQVEFSGQELRVIYLPAGEEQEKEVEQKMEQFEKTGAEILFKRDLYMGVPFQLLNTGTAYGTLLLKSPEDLEKDVVSFKDILVLTRLPNELPVVGGTITAEMQTPLAHVNVAARNRGTPNMSLPDADTDEKVTSLLNKIVKFEVKNGSWSLTEATLEEAKEYWGSIKKEERFPESDLENEKMKPLEDINFSDSLSYGVKAANVAELSKLLGQNAPAGFAVPFFYYDQFLKNSIITENAVNDAKSDCIDEDRSKEICSNVAEFVLNNGKEKTLDNFIDTVLSDERFNTDSPYREATLDALKYFIGHLPVDTGFATKLRRMIEFFHGDNPVRLRSSTNAEDLEDFSGAGLYRSVTAYASGNDSASSQIRKVWASVWNYSAFEERSLWNIDHKSVKMGVLVHQSFPDEDANGVLITQNISDPTVYGHYVNVQKGEISVTNPEGGALPEIFVIIPGAESQVQISHLSWSSLSPGESILTNEDISELFQLSDLVHSHFSELYGQNELSSIFDIEFKFIPPHRKLIIKQVRPYISQ